MSDLNYFRRKNIQRQTKTPYDNWKKNDNNLKIIARDVVSGYQNNDLYKYNNNYYSNYNSNYNFNYNKNINNNNYNGIYQNNYHSNNNVTRSRSYDNHSLKYKKNEKDTNNNYPFLKLYESQQNNPIKPKRMINQSYNPNINNNSNNKYNFNYDNFNNNFLNINNYNQLSMKNGNSLDRYSLSKSCAISDINNIMDDFNFEKTHSSGLNNIGATCYMNATLQCLANVKNLTTKLLNQFQNNDKNSHKYKLTNAYVEVLMNIWKSNKKSYSPYNFKKIISEMNPLFDGIQANDSKDLILFLLETLHKELNTAEKGNNINPNNINQYDYQSSFNAFSNYFTNNYRSVISDTFYGMFNSMMTCFNCHCTVNNIQCFNLLIFPLNEVKLFKNKNQNCVNIYECFEYYQRSDIMSGNNQIYCNKCSSMSNSVNVNKLIISPNVLIINLNRGRGLQFNININFEEYLDISNFVFYNKGCPTYYQLIGIVTHFGPSSMDGHFIAFCKSFKNNKWYKYNDGLVTPSNFSEARSTGIPYILFYSSEKSNNLL